MKEAIYFKEPRLHMTLFGRFVVRLVGYSLYGLLAVSALVFVVSEIPWLRSVGILFILFLIDRFLVFKKAPRSLDRIDTMPGRINAVWFITQPTYRVLEWSVDRASLQGGDPILYVVKSLLSHKGVRKSLWRMDVDPAEFENKVDEYIHKSTEDTHDKKEVIAVLNGIVLQAFQHARDAHSHYVEPIDLLAAVGHLDHAAIQRLFVLFEISAKDLEHALIFSRARSRARKYSHISQLIGSRHRKGHRVMNRAWTARPTRTLDALSTDLTDMARRGEGGFLVGHQTEYDRLTDVLSRSDRPNALLVGEPGIGKEAVVHHLAFNIIRDRVPKPLFDKRLVSLEIGSLVAGASEGELEERVKKVVNEIITAGNVILFIPDIHNLLQTSTDRLSAADILLPAIREGAFAVIGATYPREFKTVIEENSDFRSTFEIINVQEITDTESIRLLSHLALLLETRHGVTISLGAIQQSVTLARKYFRQKPLPGSAADLLRETLADAVEKKKETILEDDVTEVAEKRINVPIHDVGQKEAEKLLQLEDIIHERLIDQEPAVAAVSRALREYRSGLSKAGRPIATFLFVGPTGVGKTELSKILAELQFGSSSLMTRFDMSEYQNKESIYQLIGSPKGEVKGNLTEAVREKPFSLVLLDEFEKAHPDILNIFLQVFDDGRLTDSFGRTVDFQNTIIIATSNAHSDFIKTELEKGAQIENISSEIKRKLTDHFKPELLNRFSDIIVFKTLSEEDVRAVTRLMLREFEGEVLESKGMTLVFDDTAIHYIADAGFDPVFGARPLRKVISEKIRGALAEHILRGSVDRGDTITVSADNGTITFHKATEQ